MEDSYCVWIIGHYKRLQFKESYKYNNHRDNSSTDLTNVRANIQPNRLAFKDKLALNCSQLFHLASRIRYIQVFITFNRKRMYVPVTTNAMQIFLTSISIKNSDSNVWAIIALQLHSTDCKFTALFESSFKMYYCGITTNSMYIHCIPCYQDNYHYQTLIFHFFLTTDRFIRLLL